MLHLLIGRQGEYLSGNRTQTGQDPSANTKPSEAHNVVQQAGFEITHKRMIEHQANEIQHFHWH